MAIKNIKQSQLHKKYIEMKRKITSTQYMLDFEKRQFWDIWCHDDERTFNRLKAHTIKQLKEDIKFLGRECKILKMKIVRANQAYDKERLMDKMHNICDEIINNLDKRKENYTI